LLVALGGLLLSVLIWLAIAAWESRGAEEEFRAAASTKLALFRGGFGDYADVMRFYQGFIDGAGGNVDGQGLDQRVAPVLSVYTGLSALAWAPRVSRSERTGFEAAARSDGRGDYRISRLSASRQLVAAAEQDEYFPILYATSKDGTGRLAGYDLGSDPARRRILEQARDTGQLIVSEVLPALTDAGEPEVMAAWAVYSGGSARCPSVGARRLNLRGFAVGILRFDAMVDGTLKRLTRTMGYHTYVYRAQAAANELPLYVHTSLRATVPAPPLALGVLERQLHASGPAGFGSQAWLAVVIPMRDPRPGLGGRQALGAFFLCLLLSSLATAYAESLHRRRQRETFLLHEVSAAQEWLATIYNSVNEGIFVSSVETGTFIEVNRAGCEMYGYAPGELFGADIGKLSSGVAPYTQAGATESLRTVKSGGKAVFEWHSKRKDGSLFWSEISVRIACIGTREVGFAVVRDITESKRDRETIGLQADQYATMLATTAVGFWTLDMRGRFLEVNDAYCRMIGYSREELLKLGIEDIEVSESPQAVQRHMAAIMASGSDHFETRHRHKDGTLIDIDGSVSFWRKGNRYLAFARNISARKRAEQELARSETRLKTVLETTVDGIVLVDVETKKFLFANQAFCNLLGYGAGELRAIGIPDIHPAETLPEVSRQFERTVRGETKVTPGLPVKRKDGSIFFADISASTMILDGRAHVVACFHDVTELKRRNELILQMSRHDPLTELANRRAFVEELERTIVRARRGTRGFAVLYLDLDHFKDVNDTLGHPAGDLLLRAVAERLTASVRTTDTIARFGGDEFAVIVSDLVDPAESGVGLGAPGGAGGHADAIEGAVASAAAVAEKILAAVSKPYSIQGNEVRSGASIGIALYGPDAADAETILTHADEALYRVKAQRRGSYRFFTDAMDSEVRARVSMNNELREAIASEQLFLLYQPQVEIETGRIIGLEARVHWHHPTRGELGPAAFIATAESSGLIVPLDRWVIRAACRQSRQWCDAGINPPPLAINVSGLEFKTPDELVQTIATALTEFAQPPQRLELEVTESVLMQVSREHNDVLQRLQKQGVRIAIDDFGNGYSSLDYLRRDPVDRIKIAENFTTNIGKGRGYDSVVRAALGLAGELGIETLAEGVESAAQIALLQAWGCPVAQGSYFAKPLTVAEVTGLLRVGMLTAPARDPVPSAVAGLRDRSDADSIQENSPAARPCAKRRAGRG